MYFKNREVAGRLLASQIAKKYNRYKTAVVALDDGGVIVGMQIAQALNCVITLLLTEDITIPQERVALAGLTHDGDFSYNHALADAEIQDMVTEYHSFIESEKMRQLHEMHEASGSGQLIRRDLLENTIVLLVSDGLKDGFQLDLALQFLKPVNTRKVMIATPLASVRAVDVMHTTMDEIFCLNVVENYLDTNHYYDENALPDHDLIIKIIEQVVGSWKTSGSHS